MKAITAIEWQEMLSLVFSSIDIKSYISPFGFEVDPKKFSPQNKVTRFYVYYTSEESDFAVLSKFKKVIFNEFRDFYENIGIWGSRKTGYEVLHDKTGSFFIMLEKINTESTAEDVYYNYIPSTLYLISRNQLPEQQRIYNQLMSRLRIKQLFYISLKIRMLEDCIYSDFIKKLSQKTPPLFAYNDNAEDREIEEIKNIELYSKEIILNQKGEPTLIQINPLSSDGEDSMCLSVYKKDFDESRALLMKLYREFYNQ